MKITNNSSVLFENLTNMDLNFQAFVDFTGELVDWFDVVVSQFWEDVLHENSVCDRVKAFWNKLFFSEVPEATTFNWREVAPIDVSIIREFWLGCVLTLVKVHINDEGNGSALSAQFSELLHFVLTTEELIVINWW